MLGNILRKSVGIKTLLTHQIVNGMINTLLQLRKDRFICIFSHKQREINNCLAKITNFAKPKSMQRYKMSALNLPKYDTKIIEEDGKPHIFDILRRTYVTLTPEEWVRQHFVHYLISHKGYPASLMANETSINLNKIKLRCDTIVYDKNLTPKVIIEYKAPNIAINQNVFSQIARYNLVLKVDYLIISNGIKHYCCKMDYTENKYTFLPDIPDYNNIIGNNK